MFYGLKPNQRLQMGLLFAVLWVAAVLPCVDGVAQMFGLWQYQVTPIRIGGMPLALYVGWVVTWGAIVPLLVISFYSVRWWIILCVVACDFYIMPEIEPLVVLHRHWWIGEVILVVSILLPAVCLAKWTVDHRMLGWRCVMLAITFGLVFIVFGMLIEMGSVRQMIAVWNGFSVMEKMSYAFLFILFSIPGASAAKDFVFTGNGTPVPMDPPQRLVTHGMYAFVKNPMQLSMTLLMVLQAVALQRFWPLVMAGIGVVYSMGIAAWSEELDMQTRFGQAWINYRSQMRNWLPLWRPNVGEPCELWVNRGCGMCREVEKWFQKRDPVKLCVLDAREWTGDRPLDRITWRHPASGRVETGVCAIAMALQHIDLRWAFLGALIGLPIVSRAIQICMDAAGAGKQQPSMVTSKD